MKNNSTTSFINIILPIPIWDEFTYVIPKHLKGHVKIGKRVKVPFGKSKFYIGIVSQFSNTLDKDISCKEIDSIIDNKPLFDDNYVRFTLILQCILK